jgi:PAS domain S-box-containing protein
MTRPTLPVLMSMVAALALLGALLLHAARHHRGDASIVAIGGALRTQTALESLQRATSQLAASALALPRAPGGRLALPSPAALESALEEAAANHVSPGSLDRVRQWRERLASGTEATVRFDTARLNQQLRAEQQANAAVLDQLLEGRGVHVGLWSGFDAWLLLAGILLVSLPLAKFAMDAWRGRRLVRSADQAVESLQALMSAAPLAFLAWNATQGVVLWSNAAERMFGLAREDVLGAALPDALAAVGALQERALSATEPLVGVAVDLRDAEGNVLPTAVSISLLPTRGSAERTVAALIEDITPRRVQEARRLDAVRAQRDALVREVHHRIKNHLQGVAGLLRQHLSGKPLLQPLLEAASAQILTIAAVHGLQGELHGERLQLRALVTRIATSISGIMQVPIVLSESCVVLEQIEPIDEETVPIAMVLNELLMNAVKHRTWAGSDALVRVDAMREGEEFRIMVRNPGFLPPRFDLQRGIHVGTGLGLVKSLLPQRGAQMRIVEQDDGVVASLTLSPPDVVRLIADCATPCSEVPS